MVVFLPFLHHLDHLPRENMHTEVFLTLLLLLLRLLVIPLPNLSLLLLIHFFLHLLLLLLRLLLLLLLPHLFILLLMLLILLLFLLALLLPRCQMWLSQQTSWHFIYLQPILTGCIQRWLLLLILLLCLLLMHFLLLPIMLLINPHILFPISLQEQPTGPSSNISLFWSLDTRRPG